MNGQTTGNVRAIATGNARRGGAGCREIAQLSTGERTAVHKRLAFTLIELPVVRKRKRRAFTLIELLVVISIIALLVAIMVPSLTTARELARRGTCASNLRNVGTALALYGEVNGEYPFVPVGDGAWNVKVGTNRATDPSDNASADRSATSNLYLLVRTRLCPVGMFVCTSAEGETPGKDSSEGRWDFAGGDNVSYALMNPYGDRRSFVESTGSIIILADGSPYFDPRTGLRNSAGVVDLGGDPDEDEVRRGNSVTHRGDGQNVTYVGGATRFERSANCGANLDNIYTRGSGSEGTDEGGTVASAEGPAGKLDTFLIP